MKRLSAARDRELRHLQSQQIAWRWSYETGAWYPWCRTCGRDAGRQINWLIWEGFATLPRSEHVSTVNVQPTDLVGPYLERYPR